MKPIKAPLYGSYKVQTDYFNNPIQLKWQKTQNMEPKRKINWARIWQIIRDIILAALTADSVRNL